MFEYIAFVLEVLVFVILSIAWFFIPAFQFCEPEANELMSLQRPEENTVKSDYIDNQLLKAKRYPINNDTFGCGGDFIINGALFKDYRKVANYREFELYKLKMDDYADTSGVSVDDDTHLQMTMETVPYGVIINSNVFLTHQHWNTLYTVCEGRSRCAVCDVDCDVTEHAASSAHARHLERYPPLAQYDLAVTRKINNNYHCGVCNILFDQSLKNDHFSSKMHEDKLLFAINKVSDIMYDYNIHDNNEKKDSYHFNAKKINNNNFNEFFNEYEDAETTDEEEEYDYNDYNYNDHWDQFNGLKDYDDDIDDYEEPVQNLEFSYASMAKKPKTDDLPDVLEVDLGNKKVTVKFNSWNMLIRPMPNRFYCMACKKFDHARHTAEHCRSTEHLDRLGACAVVDEYEKYFVRQVDDKCYHCGHCNNLQLINVMEDHIRSHHTNPASAHALLDSPAKKISANPKPNTTKRVNSESDQTEVQNNDKKDIDTTVAMYEGLRAANNNFDDIIICTFGSKLRVSKLAFNIVCQGENDFYCGLCEVNIGKEHLKNHINDVQHLTRLQRTPFIQAFSVHLFREIRDALHCALCNELIQIMPEFIIKHKYLEKHIVSSNRALGYIKDTAETKSAQIVNNGAIASAKPKPIAAEISKIVTNVTNKNEPAVIRRVNIATVPIVKEALVTNKNVPSNNILANNKENIPVGNNIPNSIANRNVAAAARNVIAINGVLNTSTAKNNGELNISTKEETRDGNAKIEADIAQAQAKTEEFIIVKNGVKEEVADDLDESIIDDFDLEEYVYVKLGNSYIKITNTSYNTLVDVGDGGKYCFVCSSVVNGELSKHVESRGHMENMEKFKFVDKYNDDLLRQFYLMYHCSICNVVITRKQLNHHLSWPTHTLQTENTKITSKKRKNEIKTGTKQYTVTTQKENIYLNDLKESDIKIYLHIIIDKEKSQVEKMNKIVIFNDNVLKVAFDFWHSLSEVPNGYRCKVCQCEFAASEVGLHVTSECHKGNLEKIDKQYSPALIRKINDTTLNCVMCNTEVSNKKHIVLEHIQGKKHIKHYEAMLKESSVANSYADCEQDVFMPLEIV